MRKHDFIFSDGFWNPALARVPFHSAHWHFSTSAGALVSLRALSTDGPFCSLGICSLLFSPLDVFSGPLGPRSVMKALFSAVILVPPLTWHVVLSLLVISLCCPTPITSDHLSSWSVSAYFTQKSHYCLFSIYFPCAGLRVSCGLHNLICSTGL